MKKIYCAGHFDFAYKDYSIENLGKDYRAMLVGGADKIAHEKSGVPVTFKDNDNVEYIGPFYFYEDQKTACDIVTSEMKKVEDADLILFYFPNDPACPGTVTELVYASLLGKPMIIAYEMQSNTGEPENEIDSPVWYPMLFAVNKNVHNALFHAVKDKQEAVEFFRGRITLLNE